MRLCYLPVKLLDVVRRYRWSAGILHVYVVIRKRFQIGGLGLFTNRLQSLECIQNVLSRVDEYPVTESMLDYHILRDEDRIPDGK